MKEIFYSTWDKLDFKDNINKDLFIVNSVNQNYKNILIHEFKYFINTIFKYCKSIKCNNCNFVN